MSDTVTSQDRLDETLSAITAGDRNAEVVQHLVQSLQALGYEVSLRRPQTFSVLTPIRALPSRIGQIQNRVCEQEGISIEEMLSNRRSANLARPRHMAIWLSLECTTASLPMIGRVFNRDHSTVLNAKKRFPVHMAADDALARRAMALRDQFKTEFNRAEVIG